MISTEQINSIVAEIEAMGINESTVMGLRQQYQPIHFTYCMDDDLPDNVPVIAKATFNLYLIDGREHCLCLTNDYDIATGIVVAEIIPD